MWISKEQINKIVDEKCEWQSKYLNLISKVYFMMANERKMLNCSDIADKVEEQSIRYLQELIEEELREWKKRS